VGRGRRWDVWLGHAGMYGSPTWQRLGQHPRVRRAFQVPEGAGWAPWHMVIFCDFCGLAPRLCPRELPFSPQEVTLGPQEVTLGPQEVTLGPQEVTLGPQEVTLVSIQDLYIIYTFQVPRGSRNV
jgi:hypothetical protein